MPTGSYCLTHRKCSRLERWVCFSWHMAKLTQVCKTFQNGTNIWTVYVIEYFCKTHLMTIMATTGRGQQ